jgi:hypothetical protein
MTMSQTNQESGATDASKTETSFLGKCAPKPNPDPDAAPESKGVATTLPDGKTEVKGAIAWWYDESDDARITGRSLWNGNYLWDGAPMASQAKVWGTAELFVDADDPNDPPQGKWELSFEGYMTGTVESGFQLIVDVVGSGKEGVVKGLTTKSVYTFDFAAYSYKITGIIK